MTDAARRRVVALGLDAISLPLADALIAEGRMPQLARLRDGSARWDVDGGLAIMRNLQWPQFGFARRVECDRGDLFSFDPATYHCAMPDARPTLDGDHLFWDRPDLRTIAFDVPETALVSGYVAITGWGGHAPRATRSSNPPGLIEELDRVVGVHRGFANDYDSIWHDSDATKALADALVDGVARRAKALQHLWQRFPDWDLTIAVISELHSAGHFWMHGVDPKHALHGTHGSDVAGEQLKRVYEAVDGAIGEIVATVPSDVTVVLFSHDDLSAGHADCPSLVLLPELLQRMHDGEGLLERIDADAWRAAGCPPVVPAPVLNWRDHVDEQLRTPLRRSWRQRSRTYRRAKRTRPVRLLLERRAGRPVGPQGNPIPAEEPAPDWTAPAPPTDSNELLFTAHYQPRWSRMRAFALPAFTCGGVRINLIGRERDGVVAIEDYAAVLDEIEAAVRACRNPRTGSSVVDAVQRPNADDPLDPHGDTYDLVFGWAQELVDAFEHPEHGLIGPVPAHRPGVHGRAGFLWARAPEGGAGACGELHACDIGRRLLGFAGAG